MTLFRKKKLGLLVSPLIMLSVAGTAMADMDLCLTPYVGVDAQMRHMGFYKDFGGNSLKKNYPQGNFFAGLKFNQYVGVELGYEASKKKSRKVTHDNSDIVFGEPLEQVDPPFVLGIDHASHSSSKINGWNANLVGFFPILCEDNSLQLIGSIGVAQLKLKSKSTLSVTEVEPIDVTGIIPGTETTTNLFNTHFTKKKAVLRLSGGFHNKITDCIGIRALVTWENTAKLKGKGKRIETGEATFSVVKPKNSFNYSLGIFTSF